MALLQMILCFETTKSAGTDYVYIKDTIDHFYDMDKRMPINTVFMGGKNQYQTHNVKRKINEFIKNYPGQSRVLFCIDTDRIDRNPAQVEDFKKVTSYCAQQGYELIWFCHDIEEVYLGSSVIKKDKVSKAKDFRVKKGIETVNVSKLNGLKPNAYTSNIMCILDKYMPRKG